MFLVITLLCVCLGVAAVAPGIGIALGVLSLPALVRTAAVVQKKLVVGDEPDLKVALFFSSLGVVLACALAGVVAFFAACGVVFGAAVFAEDVFISLMRWTDDEDIFIGILLLLGGVPAVAVATWVFVKYWPRRD